MIMWTVISVSENLYTVILYVIRDSKPLHYLAEKSDRKLDAVFFCLFLHFSLHYESYKELIVNIAARLHQRALELRKISPLFRQLIRQEIHNTFPRAEFWAIISNLHGFLDHLLFLNIDYWRPQY